MKKYFDFGQKVKYNNKFIRAFGDRKDGGLVKLWKKIECNGDGIFLGTRFLQNGIRYYDYEEGYSFIPDEHFEVALVCPSRKENPIYIPIESISD